MCENWYVVLLVERSGRLVIPSTTNWVSVGLMQGGDWCG